MGIDTEFGRAFAKAQLGAGTHLPLEGTVFISVNDRDKSGISTVAEAFVELGFKVVATEGTHKILRRNSIESKQVLKVHDVSVKAFKIAGKIDFNRDPFVFLFLDRGHGGDNIVGYVETFGAVDYKTLQKIRDLKLVGDLFADLGKLLFYKFMDGEFSFLKDIRGSYQFDLFFRCFQSHF